MAKKLYAVQQIRATQNDEGDWIWDDAIVVDTFKTERTDLADAFRAKLYAQGIQWDFPTTFSYDGNIAVATNSYTGEPLFALVPMFDSGYEREEDE